MGRGGDERCFVSPGRGRCGGPVVCGCPELPRGSSRPCVPLHPGRGPRPPPWGRRAADRQHLRLGKPFGQRLGRPGPPAPSPVVLQADRQKGQEAQGRTWAQVGLDGGDGQDVPEASSPHGPVEPRAGASPLRPSGWTGRTRGPAGRGAAVPVCHLCCTPAGPACAPACAPAPCPPSQGRLLPGQHPPSCRHPTCLL